MPQYKVLEKGFHGGKIYDPNGKRPVLTTDKPFTKKNPMPKWLGPMPKESAALKAKREAAEKAQAELTKAQAESDEEELKAASTEGGEGETSFLTKVKDAVTGKSNVETL